MSQLSPQGRHGSEDSAQLWQEEHQNQNHNQRHNQRRNYNHHNNDNHSNHGYNKHNNHNNHSQHTRLVASPSSPTLPTSPSSASFTQPFRLSSGPASPTLLQNSASTSSASLSSRSRKAAPSPLHTSTVISTDFSPSLSAAISSPSSASPRPSDFDFPFASPSRRPPDVPQIVTTSPAHAPPQFAADKTYFDSDSSRESSPAGDRAESPVQSLVSPRTPNEPRSFSDSVLPPNKPLAGSTISTRAAMAAGSSAAPRPDAHGMLRNASVDSGRSTPSNISSGHRKHSTDSDVTTHDIPSIIKAAGSPEAVIEHLLKEKQAQHLQNSQMWRLVDKQRAMILGLNKDLERALRDKERYRKRVKELTSDPAQLASNVTDSPPAPAAREPDLQTMQTMQDIRAALGGREAARGAASVAVTAAAESNTVESPTHTPVQSPVDVSMAPYPITPPADQPSHGPPTSVGELLDPVSSMPRPQDHALDHFDHEAADREADSARKQATTNGDFPINFSLPPSRSLPSVPPQVPPPRIPPPPASMSSSADTKALNEGIAQFPPPPAPPPRKPPPAPLKLRELRPSPSIQVDDEVLESDSDYDSLLEVKEIADAKRGRRRTREEDDHVREVLAFKEAEMRSLSKKSKSSAHSTSKAASAPSATTALSESDAESVPKITQTIVVQASPDSLDVFTNGNRGGAPLAQRNFSAPLMSPGLPLSPRPVGLSKSPMHSPPLSPRLATGFSSLGPTTLAPRPPRQPIPLPPNTPLQTPIPAHAEPAVATVAAPKPLNIVRTADLSVTVPSSPSTKSETSLDSPAGAGRSGRTRVFKGFVTDEYPDLLLPPNALPSIDIRVASSRMKPSRASLMSLTQLEEDPVFTLAVISRADGGELWRVEKDSVSLAKLDQRMKQCAAFTARTPDRSLFSGHAPAKLDARRQALELYLEEMVNSALDTPTALELCKYLSTHTLPPNADETGSTAAEVAKEIGHKTGAGGRPLKNGYLTKRGKNFGGWKARFFMLDGPVLKYYETPGGAHLGSIKLRNAQIGKQAQNNDTASPGRPGTSSIDDTDNQYRHAFLILEPKKKDPSALTKHVLCAESDRERDQWVDTLLRWIDYRDPDEDDDVPPPTNKKEAERQQVAHDNSSRPSGSSTPKKRYGPSKKQQRQHNSSVESKDALIGMSYDQVQAGETPQGAPGAPIRHVETEPTPASTSQSPYAISAPRDPQVLTDSALWANRALMGGGGLGGLAPPSVEEKKVRKRSFFGFGMKTRASGEGSQDALFGDSGGPGHGGSSGSGGSGRGGYNGPVRQVFGAPLAEAVYYNAPTDVRVPLPAVVYRCIQYLDARGATSEEGIFRLSGSNVVIKQLRERFNTEGDVNLLKDDNYPDIHAVASLLKLYLRELPTTILSRELHMQFVAVTEMGQQEEKLAALRELAVRLPEANGTLLRYLIAFLIKIINRAGTNKMTVRNVGIVFSPTLNIPAPVFALLLQNYEAIFGIEPEEYELPSPGSTSQSDGSHRRRPSLSSSLSMGTGVDAASMQQRPPTAQAGGSPHRQRLLEAMQAARSTPTPPPLTMSQSMPQFSQARSTPTPPPMQALPVPPAQRAKNAANAANAANAMSAMGYDQRPMGYEPQYAQPAGYDRAFYEGAIGGGGNRRESAILPGGLGLNGQGAPSRLREESRY